MTVTNDSTTFHRSSSGITTSSSSLLKSSSCTSSTSSRSICSSSPASAPSLSSQTALSSTSSHSPDFDNTFKTKDLSESAHNASDLELEHSPFLKPRNQINSSTTHPFISVSDNLVPHSNISLELKVASSKGSDMVESSQSPAYLRSLMDYSKKIVAQLSSLLQGMNDFGTYQNTIITRS